MDGSHRYKKEIPSPRFTVIDQSPLEGRGRHKGPKSCLVSYTARRQKVREDPEHGLLGRNKRQEIEELDLDPLMPWRGIY